MPSCPECVARERGKVQEQYEEDVHEDDRNRDELNKLLDEVDVPMKMDTRTKHFICKRCGLYATREQVGDIKAKINRREYTKEDRHYDYQQWWTKSKKDKQEA